jgi:hypothetical protein
MLEVIVMRRQNDLLFIWPNKYNFILFAFMIAVSILNITMLKFKSMANRWRPIGLDNYYI